MGDETPKVLPKPPPDGDPPLQPTGYKNPPVEHRFKSGNTFGSRPRKRRPSSLAQHLAEAGRKKVRIKVGDREMTMPKDEAIASVMTNKALHGTFSDQKKYVELRMRLDAKLPAAEKPYDTTDHVAVFRARIEAMRKRVHEERDYQEAQGTNKEERQK